MPIGPPLRHALGIRPQSNTDQSGARAGVALFHLSSFPKAFFQNPGSEISLSNTEVQFFEPLDSQSDPQGFARSALEDGLNLQFDEAQVHLLKRVPVHQVRATLDPQGFRITAIEVESGVTIETRGRIPAPSPSQDVRPTDLPQPATRSS